MTIRAFIEENITAEPNTGCWLWMRALSRGYGTFGVGGRLVKAHRAAYEEFVGPIPPGLTIDHLCRTPACVNPAHMEPVTAAENMMRGNWFVAMHARQTECLRGHSLSDPTTVRILFRKGGRERVCLICAAIRKHSLKLRKAA